jgi:drug/metabolite transporter (DMT)-like permease
VSTAALVLVLVAALAHAAWNVLAKTASGGAAFVWLFSAAAVVIWVPAAAVAAVVAPGSLGLEGVAFMAGSGALHALYFVLLQRGYRDGDLSLVYPLARGTGPLLSTLAAIVIFAERPSALALAGGAIIVVAVFSLAGVGSGAAEVAGAGRAGVESGAAEAARAGVGSGAAEVTRAARAGVRVDALRRRRAIGFALLTGVAIASYTLWDKQAVGPLGLAPVVYYWGANVAETALLTPFVAHRSGEVRRTWLAHRRQVLGVAVLSPLAYILVLFALAHAPVSYVAPARELSILVGAVAGITVLDEGQPRRRMLAAAAIFVGIVALAVG